MDQNKGRHDKREIGRFMGRTLQPQDRQHEKGVPQRAMGAVQTRGENGSGHQHYRPRTQHHEGVFG